ncbi:hypothetical protein [Streptomyces microflavus]|uniref:hypothetical protein n=1 Tax=Streptomyces microflavus TaxID=1919 RepID=UPI002E32475E|nr:hypothetical protein [Streptomyces microflavus]
MTVSFGVRRHAAADYNHRSRGGPVTGFAQVIHATLFGLPADNNPLPTALDELLQATHTATTPDQHIAILRQLAEQMRNAAEIIQRYQYQAQWDQLPDNAADHLRKALDQAQFIATTIDRVAPAFEAEPAGTPPPSRTAANSEARVRTEPISLTGIRSGPGATPLPTAPAGDRNGRQR